MQYFLTNAFTSTPYSGNPACVVVPVKSVGKSLTTEQMHKLAAEISAVETAFVLPPLQPKTDFHLRFFTKTKENPFCGHATIAAAHILSSEFGFRSNEFYFTTKNGVVVVKRKAGKYFELNLRPSFPTLISLQPQATSGSRYNLERSSSAMREGILKVLGALRFQAPKTATVSTIKPGGSSGSHDERLLDIEKELVPKYIRNVYYHKQSKNLIILFNAAWVVMAARPDFAALMAVAPDGTNKVTLTAMPVVHHQNKRSHLPDGGVKKKKEEEGTAVVDEDSSPLIPNIAAEGVEARWRKYDFITRLFAPWFGINEDAVSGASHAILANLWRHESSIAAQHQSSQQAGGEGDGGVPASPLLHSKTSLSCYQPSPRGGEVMIDIQDSERIGISGEAVSIAHGTVLASTQPRSHL